MTDLDIPPLVADPAMKPAREDKLEKGRRKARRSMAWFSFWFLVFSCTAILYKLLFGDDPTVIAAALVTASPVLTGMFTAFTLIVVGYLGVSVSERIFKKD
jgi:hypothetical protein